MVERAIFGKVSGQRSDYRWIGRSSRFAGHEWDIHRRLSIGLEDAPRRMSLWYYDAEHSRCYAAFCYPSPARDANDRSGFFEKQIFEWNIDRAQPASLAALVLLKQISSFDSSDWTPRADDPQWKEKDFCLPLSTERVELSQEALVKIVERGLAGIARIEESALIDFYAGMLRRTSGKFLATGARSPAFLRVEGSLGPEGLAVLMLPFEEDQLTGMSIAGGLPVGSVDETQLRHWTGVAGQANQVKNLRSFPWTSDEMAFANMIVLALRKREYPRTADLLKFALSEERWREPLSFATGTPPSDLEKQVFEQALEVVTRQIATSPGWKEEPLVLARQRHLETKKDVIVAAAIRAWPSEFQHLVTPSRTRIVTIGARWDNRSS